MKDQGWRYHMSNMAVIGSTQLKRFESFSAKRKNIAIQYNKILIQIKTSN